MKKPGTHIVLLGFQALLLLPAIAGAQQLITQTFTSSGMFAVPAGVTSVDVQVWGGGGGGGGADSYKAKNRAGGGGAGGSFTAVRKISVGPGTQNAVTAGARGSGGAGGKGQTQGGKGRKPSIPSRGSGCA